jgi:TatD DNase family protein
LDLTAARLSVSIDEVIAQAQQAASQAEATLAGCVHVSCSLESLRAVSGLLEATAPPACPIDVRLAIGIHPHDASTWNDDTEAAMTSAASTLGPRLVAIGECGLDYHYMNSPREAQLACFRAQVALAGRQRLPLVVHTREAEEDTLAILAELLPHREWPVHIHCFTGSAAFAQQLLGLSTNLCIGITGAATFSSAKGLHAAIQAIPLERLLLETDAPYMAPVPFRGKVCHSGLIPYIARRIAALKDTTPDLVFAHCRDNTRRLYGF